jgi:hypothetical protein
MDKEAKPKALRAVLRDGQFAQVPDHEVDIELGNPNKQVGINANLVPLASAVAGGRVFYGSRFQTQALPLTEPEAPLVQNLDEDDPQGRSFDEQMGGPSAGAISGSVDGGRHCGQRGLRQASDVRPFIWA